MSVTFRKAAMALTFLLVASAAGPAAADCTSNADCKGGRVCRAGQCADATCTKDTDCPGEAVCRSGVCSPGASVSPGPTATPMRPAEAPRYEVRTRGIPALYIAGPILLGTAYVTGIAVTAATTWEQDRGKHVGIMAIPIAGPWVLIPQSTNDHSFDGALVAAGIAQASGLIMTILGVAIRREVKVPVVSLLVPEPGKPRLAPGPVGATGVGLHFSMTSF